MKLTWLGHACFLLEQAGYTVLLDPYTGVEGYPPLRAAAHQVFCSHQHFDHCAVELAEPLPARECPFAVREVPTFHDGQGGALRGENTIRVFSAGGFTAAHLGDLGHQLSQAQLEAVGQVDLVMVPVGGTYTVDAAGAKQVCEALSPKWTGPMHYRHAPYGLPNVDGVGEFLSMWPAELVHRLDSSALELPLPDRGVWVPQFQA